MNFVKEIGVEINEILKTDLSILEKSKITYEILSSIISCDKKPSYELWERAIKDMSSNLSLETITNHISLLTLIEPSFSVLPHMEIHAFLRKLNPEAKKARVSLLEKQAIERKFYSFLKKVS